MFFISTSFIIMWYIIRVKTGIYCICGLHCLQLFATRDSSGGRAVDCSVFSMTSIGHWFDSGSRERFSSGNQSKYMLVRMSSPKVWCIRTRPSQHSMFVNKIITVISITPRLLLLECIKQHK